MKKELKKTTNGKPISLHPLKFEDALKSLFKVKPDKRGRKKDGKN